MHDQHASTHPRVRTSTLFWRLAALLAGALVATAVLSVLLAATLVRSESSALIERSLTLRLDALAREIEDRAVVSADTIALPDLLRYDLATRFADPLALIDTTGVLLDTFEPGGLFAEAAREAAIVTVPDSAVTAVRAGRIAVSLDVWSTETSWAAVPLLDDAGYPVAGVVVQPLTGTVEEEAVGAQRAYRNALLLGGALALGLALVLGGALTWWLVRPIRRFTQRVERIGEGDYAARLPVERADEIGRLAAAINDMAAQVEASIDALAATGRMRRELVANVGHDLRTPLTAIRGYLDEAARFLGENRPDAARDALAIAQRQSRQMTSLVSDLFELSTLEQAAASMGDLVGTLRLGPVPLGELARDAARAHTKRFADAGVTLDTDLPDGLPVLRADGARLMRVLDNLLSNALRHTPAGGTVRLSVEASDSVVSLHIADTGEGIPPEQLATVFERYYRGTSARTRDAAGASGSGLGLAISRAIAHAHGGDLTATSTDGKGATFTLTLPTGHLPQV
ncbi:MAG: HAMP domain-containing sensor histidine kinase [Bacteroidota bacterium]